MKKLKLPFVLGQWLALMLLGVSIQSVEANSIAVAGGQFSVQSQKLNEQEKAAYLAGNPFMSREPSAGIYKEDILWTQEGGKSVSIYSTYGREPDNLHLYSGIVKDGEAAILLANDIGGGYMVHLSRQGDSWAIDGWGDTGSTNWVSLVGSTLKSPTQFIMPDDSGKIVVFEMTKDQLPGWPDLRQMKRNGKLWDPDEEIHRAALDAQNRRAATNRGKSTTRPSDGGKSGKAKPASGQQ